MMKHLSVLSSLVKTLLQSDVFHALVVQSPPGWGKSTAIDGVLSGLGSDFVAAGSYATPLHIYNTLCENPRSLIVFDDCAGVFSDVKSMSLLKAATWKSSGALDAKEKSRRVAWGSTSEKVPIRSVDFLGKIILLTNTLSAGRETEAFLTRCLSYKIRISPAEVRSLLLEAASSQQFFPDAEAAREVASFLCDKLNNFPLSRLNLRTLMMGYELSLSHPGGEWRELLRTLHSAQTDEELLGYVFEKGVRTHEQERRFYDSTGLARRSFFNYKRRLGLSRPYARKPHDESETPAS